MPYSFALFLALSLGIVGKTLAAEGGGGVLFVDAPEARTAEGRAVAEKAKAEMSGRGIAVKELPAEDLDEAQVSALADGGVVIKPFAVDDKLEFKAYDLSTGRDISKTFYAGSAPVKPMPAISAARSTTPANTARASVPSEWHEGGNTAERRTKERKVQVPSKTRAKGASNRLGIAAGPAGFSKNKDSLDTMAANNANASTKYDKAMGLFRLFYEHDLSDKYGIGIAAEATRWGHPVYEDSGRTLTLSAAPKGAMLYGIRHFGRHFGLYLGGGAAVIDASVNDQSNLIGLSGSHPPFTAKILAPEGEAGMILAAGAFSLRLSLRKVTSASSDDLEINGSRVKSRLIVHDGKTLRAGSQLNSGEEYFKLDFGGVFSAVTINYAFAGW